MKFFNVKLPSYKIHTDGISFDNSFSIRLSNIPKNFSFMLNTANQFSIKLVAGLFGLIKVVQADSCNFPLDPSAKNDYFDTQSGGNLLLKQIFGPNLVSALVNSTLGISSSYEQNVPYSKRDCACKESYGDGYPSVPTTYQSVEIWGFNVTDELVDSVVNFIKQTYCPSKSDWLTAIAAIGLIIIMFGGGSYLLAKYLFNHEPELQQDHQVAQDPLLSPPGEIVGGVAGQLGVELEGIPAEGAGLEGVPNDGGHDPENDDGGEIRTPRHRLFSPAPSFQSLQSNGELELQSPGLPGHTI
ncbi:MAG: hypothetical protein JSR33_06480 [Proteobacteria bacterium]|nr:hypothetical protein [Pseudomonadota bacterium]